MVECSDQYVECRIAWWLWCVVSLALIFVGTGGNILNIIVLSRRKLRRYSTSVYLLVLAVSDTLCLWTIVPKHTYMNLFDLDYLSISYIHCKFVDWLGFSSGTISTWTIVNLTIERVLLTMYPIKAKVRLTPKISVLVSITTICVSQIFAVPAIFSRAYSGSTSENSTNFSICAFSSKELGNFYKTTWYFIAILWFNVLPVAMIITGNILIGTTLWKRKKQIYPTPNASQQNLAREKMALKMLFTISLLHVIFTSPFGIYSVVKAHTNVHMSPKEQAVNQLIIVILYMLMFCNYTFNFALYFARGSLFREECNELFSSFKKRFMKLNERSGAENAS